MAEKREYHGTGGVRLPVTKRWLAAAREAIERYDGGQAAVAFKLGLKPSTLSTVLAGEMKTSSLVDPISRELDIPRPVGADISSRTLDIMDDIDALDASDYDLIVGMVKTLAEKAKKDR